MNLNLSPFKKGFVFGSLISLTTSLSLGALVYYGDVWVPLQPEPSLQEEEVEMREWSSQLQDPSHKNFNPFLWKYPPHFGYKK